jgi:mRNA interferase MazF
VLLLSLDNAYAVRRSVTIAPITTRTRGLPVEVALGEEDGLPRASVVNADDITTVRKMLLSQQIATLSVQKMAEVKSAIRFALALD